MAQGTSAKADTALAKRGRGKPKTALDLIWDEHRRRRAAGDAFPTVSAEVAWLQNWGSCQGIKILKRTIQNRLLSRFGEPERSADRYKLNLLESYRQCGFADRALKHLADEVRARLEPLKNA